MAVISFIVILSVLILVHECGHFFAARKLGIKVEEFGIGYPPKLWGKKIKGIVYSINLLPIGGFVKMLGEDSGEQVKNKKDLKRSFFNQSKKVRIAVLVAGVVMNFLLGVVLFAVIYTKIGIPEPVDYLVVTGIAEDSPAVEAGIKLEDKIVAVEGMEKPEDRRMLSEAFARFTANHQGEEILLVMDDGRKVMVQLRVKEDIPEGQGPLGVAVTSVDTVLYPYWQRPFRGAYTGLKEALAWGREIVSGLGQMFYCLLQGEVPKDVAGPVGIYEISKDVTAEGFLTTLQFIAILSINLSILNLLPLPALDGGRLLFIAIEMITRRRVKPEVEQVIHLLGMAFLLGLMVLITIQDVKRLMG